MILTFILSGDYCSVYETDIDIIKSLPFSINIESKPSGAIDETSVVFNSAGHVTHLYLVHEKVIPSSVFCLSHLRIDHDRKFKFREWHGNPSLRNWTFPININTTESL